MQCNKTILLLPHASITLIASDISSIVEAPTDRIIGLLKDAHF